MAIRRHKHLLNPPQIRRPLVAIIVAAVLLALYAARAPCSLGWCLAERCFASSDCGSGCICLGDEGVSGGWCTEVR